MTENKMQRRGFLQIMATAVALVLIKPINAFAAIWNSSAFEAVKLDEATNHLNVEVEIVSQDIIIMAPDQAENGAIWTSPNIIDIFQCPICCCSN